MVLALEGVQRLVMQPASTELHSGERQQRWTASCPHAEWTQSRLEKQRAGQNAGILEQGREMREIGWCVGVQGTHPPEVRGGAMIVISLHML